MTFYIFTPRGSCAGEWEALIDQLPSYIRDIHYTPAYARVQSHLGDVYAAVGRYGDNFILQPFILRGGKHKDIVNLYGCGGPVANSLCHFDEFDYEFSEWRGLNGVLCEYTQLNPFIWGHQHGLIGSAFQTDCLKKVVTVNLNQTDRELLESFSRNRRRGVKDALSRGVQITVSQDWPAFAALYRQSMDRLNATEYWHYPDKIWGSYLQELGPQRVSLLKAELGDVVEGMLLVMHAYGKAYAHFLGTSTSASNDLLYYESMKLCRDKGAMIYQLGGGLSSSSNDPLFLYKKSFSKLEAPVLIYKRIFNEDAYVKACSGLPQTEFFPAYRVCDANGASSNAA